MAETSRIDFNHLSKAARAAAAPIAGGLTLALLASSPALAAKKNHRNHHQPATLAGEAQRLARKFNSWKLGESLSLPIDNAEQVVFQDPIIGRSKIDVLPEISFRVAGRNKHGKPRFERTAIKIGKNNPNICAADNFNVELVDPGKLANTPGGYRGPITAISGGDNPFIHTHGSHQPRVLKQTVSLTLDANCNPEASLRYVASDGHISSTAPVEIGVVYSYPSPYPGNPIVAGLNGG